MNNTFLNYTGQYYYYNNVRPQVKNLILLKAYIMKKYIFISNSSDLIPIITEDNFETFLINLGEFDQSILSKIKTNEDLYSFNRNCNSIISIFNNVLKFNKNINKVLLLQKLTMYTTGIAEIKIDLLNENLL